jgi:uncharacterized RDD family membrane protein YckC
MAPADRGTTGEQGGGTRVDAAAAYLPPEPAPATRSGIVPADWWPRVGATLLDQLLLVVIFVLAAILLTIGGADPFHTRTTRVAVILLGLLYATLMLAFHRGQTVGKEVAHVRVVAEDGRPVGFGRAFGREAIKAVFGYTGIIWIVDVLWPLWQSENRALHDLIAGTRVVVAPKGPPNGYYDAGTGDPT